MNIYQKLVEVRKMVKYLEKSNEGYQFKYVSSSQVLASVKEKMDSLGLLLIPSVTKTNLLTKNYTKIDNKGKEKEMTDYFTEIWFTFTWVNAENPEEKIETAWYGQGIDTEGEKGVGKAMTYAEKYFMLKFFNIPTDKDDPDSFQRKIEDSQPMNASNNGESLLNIVDQYSFGSSQERMLMIEAIEKARNKSELNAIKKQLESRPKVKDRIRSALNLITNKDGLDVWDENGDATYHKTYLDYVTIEYKKRKDMPKEKSKAEELRTEILSVQKILVEKKINNYDVATHRINSMKKYLNVSKIVDCDDEKLLNEYLVHLKEMLPENSENKVED